MSNYLWDITLDEHDKEFSLGINLGASWYYKSLRITLSFMKHSLHFSIERMWKDV
jgi:hypothetical protein